MEQQIRLEQVRDFHPDHIFDCGQCFRWEREADGSYTGIAGGRIANISFIPDCGLETERTDKIGEQAPKGVAAGVQRTDAFGISDDTPGTVLLSNVTEQDVQQLWKPYLDLERDYGTIKQVLQEKDPIMERAIRYGRGIRILQQDPWEALLCFLISQNNNIPRIKKCIEALCSSFGAYRGTYRGKAYYDYPAPEVLAALSVEDLASCRLGYRAKYLIGSGKKVVQDGPERLQSMAEPAIDVETAFAYLTEFPGVGPKVANCILLFGMRKYESFPIDTWVKKVMGELYGIRDPKEMKSFAQKQFGQYGGFAQQYLFYYMRWFQDR